MSDGDAEATRRHHREERQDDERSGQPELLADHREEEVGVRLGEVEHLLPALAEPHTPQAPRAEGDERLLELEVDTERIAVGVKEGDDARPAIGRLPRHRDQRRERRQRRERHQPGRHPAHEEHEDEQPHRERGRPEVGLEQHEPGDQPHHQVVRHDAELEGGEARALLHQRARQVQHERELGELGGLDAERAQVEPAARPPAREPDARDEDQHERHQDDDEQRVGRPAIGVRRGDHRAEPDGEEMLAEEEEGVAEVLLAVEVAHVEDHDDAQPDERRHREYEPRIAAEHPPQARALPGEGTAEGRRSRGTPAEPARPDHASASTAARKARPRAA